MSQRPQCALSTSLLVHAIPNAPSNTIVGWHGEALKVKVRSIPEKGGANKTLCRLQARTLGIPGSGVSVISGEKSRRNVLSIEGLTSGALGEKLACLLKKREPQDYNPAEIPIGNTSPHLAKN